MRRAQSHRCKTRSILHVFKQESKYKRLLRGGVWSPEKLGPENTHTHTRKKGIFFGGGGFTAVEAPPVTPAARTGPFSTPLKSSNPLKFFNASQILNAIMFKSPVSLFERRNRATAEYLDHNLEDQTRYLSYRPERGVRTPMATGLTAILSSNAVDPSTNNVDDHPSAGIPRPPTRLFGRTNLVIPGARFRSNVYALVPHTQHVNLIIVGQPE